MAITFVGGESTTAAATTITVNLPAGTAENDVSYAACDVNLSSDTNIAEDSATWGELADLYSNDSGDTNLGVFRKVQGATPDSTVTMSGGASANRVGLTYVLRGVDTTTPEDAATTTATGVDTGQANPPSITTATAGAWVLPFAASADTTTPTNALTNYSNLEGIGFGSSSAAVVVCSREIASPSAEDPPIYTDFQTTATRSWSAATVAAKPAAGGSAVTGTSAQTLPSLTQSASGAEKFTGTAAQTLPKLTQAASGSTSSADTGTVAQMLPSLAQAAAAEEGFTGTVAQILPSLQQAAAGDVASTTVTGTVAQTLPSLAQSIIGIVTNPLSGLINPGRLWIGIRIGL